MCSANPLSDNRPRKEWRKEHVAAARMEGDRERKNVRVEYRFCFRETRAQATISRNARSGKLVRGDDVRAAIASSSFAVDLSCGLS